MAELKLKKRSSIGMMDTRGSVMSIGDREGNFSPLSKTPKSITLSRKRLSPLKKSKTVEKVVEAKEPEKTEVDSKPKKEKDDEKDLSPTCINMRQSFIL